MNSREQFEHALYTLPGYHKYDEQRDPRNPDRYCLDRVQFAWEAWQASRECIEVELPFSSRLLIDWRAGTQETMHKQSDIIKALEAQGIKVKD